MAGVFTSAVTPFRDDGSVDQDSLRSLLTWLERCGVDGVSVLGPEGEADRLTGDEAVQVVRTTLKAAEGRLPVLVDVSAAGIDNLVLLARRVMDAGAAGVLVAPVHGLQTDEAIYSYFDEIARRLGDIPWILQDQPAATGVHLAAYLLIRMIHDFPNLAALRHGDRPGVAKISQLRDAERQGNRRIGILAGPRIDHLPQALGRGVDGALTGFSYPEALIRARELHAAGKREDAEDIHDAYLPLIRHEQQPRIGLAVRKYLLARRGAIRHARCRAPAVSLDVLDSQEIDHLVRRLERRTRQLGIGLPVGTAG